MPANTPVVQHFQPFIRNGRTCDGLVQSAQWVDNLVLATGVAKSYTPPTGTNPAGGVVTAAGPAGSTANATIFRITANGGPIYLNANGQAAVVPVADDTDGDGVVIIPAGLPYFLSIPINNQPLSFIAPQPTVVAIEAWW